MNGPHPFTVKLLAWYGEHARELPWRVDPKPYPTWLSEVILQQTRVDTGTAYWHRFMAAFPNVHSLASASAEDVMAQWKGLGYYSRARNLHAAAQAIVNQHKGELPETAAGWQSLPGIGPYTAAAISSICYGEPVAVIDGNVQRVLSRLFDIDQPVDRKSGRVAIESAAQALVASKEPGISNQAWMELGALVCKPKNPNCAHCPLNSDCLSRRAGNALERPVKQPKKRPKEVAVHFEIRRRRVDSGPIEWWIERRPESGIWGGLESFPLAMSEEHLPSIPPPNAWGPVLHILTHMRMNAWFHFSEIEYTSTSSAEKNQGQWIAVEDGERTWPRLIDKVLSDLQRHAVKN